MIEPVKKPTLELISGGLDEKPSEAPTFLFPKLNEKEKDPPDWLTPMTEGTVFLCRRRHSGELQQQEWFLVNNRHLCYQLYTNLNQEFRIWVIPREFTKSHELIEVLEEGRE